MKEVQEARRIKMLHQPSKVYIRFLLLMFFLLTETRDIYL